MAQPTTEECRAYSHSLWTTCDCPRHRARRSLIMKMNDAGVLHRVVGIPTLHEAWRALDDMLARGLNMKQIGKACGLNHESLQGALWERRAKGRERTFHPLVRRALVAGEMRSRDWRPAMVPVWGPARRLQALAWMGWTADDLVAQSTLSKSEIQKVRSLRRPNINLYIAEEIERLYDALWDKDGGSPITRGYAKAHGWVSPLAWDDETIDEEHATPYAEAHSYDEGFSDEKVNERFLCGRVLEQIAEEIGIKPHSLLRRLERHGRTELADALRAGRLGSINPTGRKVSA